MSDIQVADPMIGALIDGRYRVRERLAHTGTAALYLAEDSRLERAVTVKIIQPERGAEPSLPGRFADEARAVARLTHPNVVATYDQGTHDGLPYLVMEHVRGRSLRDLLRSRRRLTPIEALAVTEQVLAALAAAHRAGLVHGDIRPEHILVAEAPRGGTLLDSVVKVTDFGAAEVFRPAAGAAVTDAGPSAYRAPELAGGGPADPRSDVYAVGAVLFEMLTGRPPQTTAPPSQYAAGVPPTVDELVRRATAPQARARPSDAGALRTDVQTVREAVTAGTATRQRPTADATVVLSRVPSSPAPAPTSPAADPEGRPSWARLPAPRGRPVTHAGARRAATEPTRHAAAAPEPLPRRLLRGGDRETRRWRMLAAGGLAVVLLLAGVAGWWLGFGRWTPAPELVGMPEAEAVALAEAEGLRVEFTDPRYDDDVAAGHVLAQEPGDRVVRGGTLLVTLSLGPEVFPVPDIIGADVEVATSQLESMGLAVQEADREYSDTVPEHRVLTVEPAVGEDVAPGDTVTVTVSRGRAPIDVPALVGRPVDEARNQLEQLELTATVTEVESDRPQGEVVAQDPAAGSGVEPGDTVTLEVSEGPPTRPVPGVRGEPCRRAAETLADAGFQPEIEGRDRGRVWNQDPSPGTGLPPGSTVTLLCL